MGRGKFPLATRRTRLIEIDVEIQCTQEYQDSYRNFKSFLIITALQFITYSTRMLLQEHDRSALKLS